MNEIVKIIKRKDPDAWIRDEGEFGGTTYYYLLKGKLYFKHIPNYFDEPISYGEIPIPSELLEDGSLQVEIKGRHGACVAGGMHGAHLHILSSKRDYCPLAENIAYTGE